MPCCTHKSPHTQNVCTTPQDKKKLFPCRKAAFAFASFEDKLGWLLVKWRKASFVVISSLHACGPFHSGLCMQNNFTLASN